MTTRKTKERTAAKTVHEITARERAVLEAFRAHESANPAPRMKVSETGGQASVLPDHPEHVIGQLLLMEAIGTMDADFVDGLVRQLVDGGSQSREVNERRLNFMLSIVKGVKPKDQVEAMLAAQIAAVHMASMTFARRLAQVENIPQQDSAERAFNKLTRTFTTQMEALKRYRTGGEQKVTVQHVSVAEGGQAIVGNVTQAPRENVPEKAAASPPALTDANAAPMPIIDESKERAPVSARRRPNK